jgi:hypothetical protein
MLQIHKEISHVFNHSNNCANGKMLYGFAIGHEMVSIYIYIYYQEGHAQSLTGKAWLAV